MIAPTSPAAARELSVAPARETASPAADDPRRRRRTVLARVAPSHPSVAGVAALTSPAPGVRRATLPMVVGAAASVRLGGLMLPIAGAIIGALLLGLPGAVIGGVGGYLLARA